MLNETQKRERKIIHIDMDYFFAQVEELDFPELKGKPVAVGGDATSRRGILCTSNYVARKYGVKSAQPTFIALKKCPELILRPVRMERYRECSKKIFAIFRQYTNCIEAMSLDEAYLDVTDVQGHFNSATLIAQKIRKQVFLETGLTCSAGVSTNKLIAKICSDINKPNGLKVVTPSEIPAFILDLPVKKINGVGPKTLEKMHSEKIFTFSDLQKYSKLELQEIFGRFGESLYFYARGIDEREVNMSSERKSLSVENTFESNLITLEDIFIKLESGFNELKLRIKKKEIEQIEIDGIFIKIKYSDFTQSTVDQKNGLVVLESYQYLIRQKYATRSDPVRLLGLGVRLKGECETSQLSFTI